MNAPASSSSSSRPANTAVKFVCSSINLGKVYETSYLGDVCIGEVIRNCCVNLGIDPDTHDGVTRNAMVFVLDGSGNESLLHPQIPWRYNPHSSVSSIGMATVQLRIEPVP